MPVIKYLQLFVFGMIVITLVQHYTKESDSDLWYLENEYNISSVSLTERDAQRRFFNYNS